MANIRRGGGGALQRGFSLLEVLVSIVVLSVGLLGVAALQMAGLRYNQSAAERSAAVIQLHSIEDVLRADRANAIRGDFNLAIDEPAGSGDSYVTDALRKWRGEIASTLGEGASGGVRCDGAKCRIEVRWDDSRASEGDSLQQVVTEVYL
ncbi:type IV pilus modification protein PilV [Crenobacter intestini]|uniref:Type IV pilus modification protein PilV n=1 Tax=Crenobacter intestini TaxID=2563443 RepID=A0A4T0UMB5_9NEIS|nr:type IV pilus modification protein PilV [Crenobacter intestini]TIC79596.1 type IV pilus modification protein PilV [Crenobacter intestini]